MMTSSNGEIFRVTGHLCGEFTGTNGQWRGALMFSLICVWINGWVNSREVGDLRRHRTHYDVIVMLPFQDQYTFVYDALLLALQPDCGAIPASDIAQVLPSLLTVDPETGQSPLIKQFEVRKVWWKLQITIVKSAPEYKTRWQISLWHSALLLAHW